MKKLFLLAGLAAFLFVGCSDDGETPNDGESSKAPEAYTQKALLEYFSGAWCPYCPDGKVYYENIRGKVGANFSAVVYHLSDNMDNIFDDDIDDKFANGYPSGMVNRVGGEAGNRGTWEKTTGQVLGETAKCGLAIDASAVSGTSVDVKVKLGIGPEALPEGNYFLTVLLTEKEMTGNGTGWDQRNAYNAQSGHPYAGKGDPIVGYVHTDVCRNVLSAPLGDELTAEQVAAGALSEFSFNADIAGLGDDLEIVAFISEYTETLTSGTTSFMYNVQRVDVGSNKDFD